MAAGKTDHALERLVFFSDAVFAIAITLQRAAGPISAVILSCFVPQFGLITIPLWRRALRRWSKPPRPAAA